VLFVENKNFQTMAMPNCTGQQQDFGKVIVWIWHNFLCWFQNYAFKILSRKPDFWDHFNFLFQV